MVKTITAIEATAKWFSLDERDGVNIEDEIHWLFGVYSKDANYVYSPQKRNDDLQKLLASNAEELSKAEKLAQKLLADNYPTNGLAKSVC